MKILILLILVSLNCNAGDTTPSASCTTDADCREKFGCGGYSVPCYGDDVPLDGGSYVSCEEEDDEDCEFVEAE